MIDQVRVGRRLEGLELVRVEATRCRPGAAPRPGRGRASPAARPAAPAAPPRRSRRRSARRGAPGRSRRPSQSPEAAAARHQTARQGRSGARARRIGPSTGCGRDTAGDAHRLQRAAVVDAEDVGALAHRQRHRGDRPPLALARRQPLLPGPGQHGADEVLARERDVERQAQRAQLAEPPQDLQVLLGAEVEVESGVDRDLLLGDPKLPGQLDSPLEPGACRWSTTSPYSRQGRSTRGGPSMCIST